MSEENTPTPLPPEAPPPPTDESSKLPEPAQRQWAMFAHLSILLGGFITFSIGGWCAFAGPLVMWLIKKDQPGFALEQSKEALNFSILVSIVSLALVGFGFMTFGVGFVVSGPLMLVVGVASIIFIVIGAAKANDGIDYRYPINWRLVK